jgi:regulator of sigma E protease
MLFAFGAYTAVAAGWGASELDLVQVGSVRAEVLPPGAAPLAQLPSGADIVAVGPRSPAHWGEIRDAFLELPEGPAEVRYRGMDGAEGTIEIRLSGDPAERMRIAGALEYWAEPILGGITPGSAGARAGFQPGDRIVEIEGDPVTLWVPFTRVVQERADEPTRVVVERDGGREVLEVVPERVEARDPVTGELRTIGRIGITHAPLPMTWARLGPVEALEFGARQTWGITVFIVDFLGQLVTGRASPRNLGSIVTIGEASGQAAQEGLPIFLSFMALLSINLAVLNLLPIPVLDGGHLVFLGLEAVRGRPVSVEPRMRWSQVGFFILIGIMVLALGNDFMRLFGL